ncbi:MAG: MerR family transcriptional regulator [Pseudomonadota bacterium]
MAEFDDGKDESALRTIGELSEALNIKPHVLRYWEQQFSLLKPLKRSGGRRYYRPEDIALVERINELVNEEGYTIKGADAVLRSSNSSDMDRRTADRRSGDRRANADDNDGSSSPVLPSGPDLTEAIAQLKSIRSRLSQAIEA